MHGHFHNGLVIIPRPILALDSVSGQYGGLGMITRPIWKCPCINLYIYIYIYIYITDSIETKKKQQKKNKKKKYHTVGVITSNAFAIKT